MRSLYEINSDIDALLSNVDEGTGELLIDPEALDALMMEKQEKLENVALYVKNITAEVNAIKAEEDALKERREQLARKKDGLTKYLTDALDGERLETARVSITYRKSEAIEINDEIFYKRPLSKFIRKKVTVSADKTAIKEAIKAGQKVRGASLVVNVNMSIK